MDNMNFKVAIPSNNGKSVSKHFGPTRSYTVVTVENGEVVNSETREKFSHHRGSHNDDEMHRMHQAKHGDEHQGQGRGQGEGKHEHKHDHKHDHKNHNRMIENILDCDLMVVGGMGSPVYKACEEAEIRPVLTEIRQIDEVIEAIKNDTIKDHKDQLH